MIVLVAMGYATLWLAVLADVVVMLIVVANGMLSTAELLGPISRIYPCAAAATVHISRFNWRGPCRGLSRG